MSGITVAGINASELIIPRINIFKGHNGRGLQFNTNCGTDSGFTDVLWRLIFPLVRVSV